MQKKEWKRKTAQKECEFHSLETYKKRKHATTYP